MTTILISAGETSGDMHAASVVHALLKRTPDIEVHGIAGPQMRDAGCRVVRRMEDLNVMGIGDVLRSLSRIRGVEADLLNWCGSSSPDLAILVDFSSFHIRLGRKLRARGIPVIHFIAPKLWAWGAWRVKRLQQSQDHLATILPFEPDWFSSRGIAHVSYVGNPSAKACRDGWQGGELKHRLGISQSQRLLALLPGSRPQELKTHIPILTQLLQRLQRQVKGLAVVVPIAPGVDKSLLEPLWVAGAVALDRTEPGYAMRADAAVAVSGTATLELALWNTPTVLIYRSSPLMIFLARRLVKLRCAGLANIILDDQPVMPELIQEQCTIDNIIGELMPLLEGGEAAAVQRQAFSKLRERLGDYDAAEGVVDLVAEKLAISGEG